ncbi:hypothetical protein A7K72_09550 [Candidatus Methylacidiphilum fumarolicum]|uniref:sulfotransferase n=1 Tax=Candidatus Methylacidiphilum fumarolicum TaxID=591154 RepID=UPI001069A7EF|nr:sulfotransferase [Candidatus Methylacidiphilum fumarolicum]TFE72014.1 hypothetical protein A7K72_09550 [Candidatus Methylacidiphilum fumarolicum]
MPQTVIVIGMHRSGSSALMRALNYLGVELGEELLEARPDNPRGFWEDKELLEINELLLKACGLRWDSCQYPKVDVSQPEVSRLWERAIERFRGKLSRGENFGMKDPRMIRLLEFWHGVFRELGVRPCYVLSLRDPLSVAESLFRRNGFSQAKSFCLWLSHYLLPWEEYAPFLKVVVSYDQLVNRPGEELERVARRLGLRMEPGVVERMKQEFLDPALRHASYSEEQLREQLGGFSFLYTVWEAFEGLAYGGQEEEAKEKIGKLSGGSVSLNELFGFVDQYEKLLDGITREKNDLETHLSQLYTQQTHIQQVVDAMSEYIAKQATKLYPKQLEEQKQLIFFGSKKKPQPQNPIVDQARFILEQGIFDFGYYWSIYPDVRKDRNDPLLHFLQYGWKERRNPHPLFDTDYYLKENEQLEQEGINPLVHFLERGWREKRNPHPLFDLGYYLGQCPQLEAEGINPLVYYLKGGWEGGKSPHALFDSSYYLEQNPEVGQEGINPLVHFLERGWREKRNPHPLFDLGYYLEQCPQLEVEGVNPLVHFVKIGWKERRNPHPLFDTDYYLRENGQLEQEGINPLVHFLERGWREKKNPHLFFDLSYYLGQCPQLEVEGVNPLVHFVKIGWKERRNPHPSFDVQLYEEAHPGAVRTNAFLHYLVNKPEDWQRYWVREEFGKKISELTGSWKNKKKGSLILFIDHVLGGGANFYRQQWIQQLEKENQLIFLFYYNFFKKGYYVQILGWENQLLLSCSCPDSFFLHIEALCEIFDRLEIIPNALVSFPDPLSILEWCLQLKKQKAVKIIVPIHDYFCVCPSYNLLNEKDQFCGIPAIEECRRCLVAIDKDETYPKTLNIDLWRRKWQDFLEHADEILCFSESSLSLLLKAYPTLEKSQIVLKPHAIGSFRKAKLRAPQPNEEVIVGIVGHIDTKAKGKVLIREMTQAIQLEKWPIKLVVIGTVGDQELEKKLHVYGPYRKEELVSLIESSMVNLCFLPSIWPETFSYVTEELMAIGAPLAVFDLGAQAEKVRRYKLGHVISHIDPRIACKELCEFALRLAELKEFKQE